jgi:hypothetical protein
MFDKRGGDSIYMAFKGKTTSGYNPKTGKQLGRANTRGKVGKNPSGSAGLPNSKTNIVTKASQHGNNPRNSRTQNLNSNRVQRVGGTGDTVGKKVSTIGGKVRQNSPKAKLVQSSRGQQKANSSPFQGYDLLANSRNVPAGRGNIRNAGSVQRTDVARIRNVANAGMPNQAIKGAGVFGKFIGQK